MTTSIAIIYYSTWGHVATLADAEARGIEEAGGTCDIFQIPETLSRDVLEKMHASPKANHPTLDDPSKLELYDAFLLGIPTRYGNFPAQWKAFWDRTGSIWQKGGYHGKYAGIFVASGTQGGGQESTVMAALSTLTHHGICFVPLGYKNTFQAMGDLTEARGGSPWGAGTFSAADGSRQPTAMELDIAKTQGRTFYEIVSKAFVSSSS